MTNGIRNTFNAGLVSAMMLALPTSSSAGKLDAILKAFENNKGYVQPFATVFGTMTNSGWYQSSSVPGGFGFYIGIPVSLATMSDEDRSFNWTAEDPGCKLYHSEISSPSQSCKETTDYKAPTIFGREKGPISYISVYSPSTKSIIDSIEVPLNDGKKEISGFNWLPFLEPQVSFSFKYTEIKVRYLTVPLDAYSLSMPGVGIQHDLASVLPPLPFSLSVVGNYTMLSASWTPGDEISGTMELNGESHFYGALIGYTYKRWLEVFAEVGWEGAHLKASGDLVIHDPATVNPQPDETVKPRLDLEGRNGYRAALNIAVHLCWDAVIGQNSGAQLGNQVSILAYRYK